MASDAKTEARPPAAAERKMEVAVASAATPVFVPGRRAFFTYRDLGVTAASRGKMRAQITAAKVGLSRPTGWHYHVCETQFVYVLKGWLELEFAQRGTVRLGEGDSVFIPGGTPHNEIRTSETFELLECSVPAEMGTVACDPPH
ncbi:MAG: cupin domain-containing protein [Rhodospirillales bacterium]|nr:cupin domain-containing protein [Rhodospirillales bacterium]